MPLLHIPLTAAITLIASRWDDAKDYARQLLDKEANRFARQSAADLNLPLNLRGLEPDPFTGLSGPAQFCAGVSSCYIPRGQASDGDYVSVEYTFGSDNPMYVVIVSSGTNREHMDEILDKARYQYADAYLSPLDKSLGSANEMTATTTGDESI